MCILNLQSKIRGTTATGPAKCSDKRDKCYRASTNVSHSESEIRSEHSHRMEAGQRLRGCAYRQGKGLSDESM